MCSDFASSIYVHTNPVSFSGDDNLRSSCNGEPTFDYRIYKLDWYLINISILARLEVKHVFTYLVRLVLLVSGFLAKG